MAKTYPNLELLLLVNQRSVVSASASKMKSPIEVNQSISVVTLIQAETHQGKITMPLKKKLLRSTTSLFKTDTET